MFNFIMNLMNCYFFMETCHLAGCIAFASKFSTFYHFEPMDFKWNSCDEIAIFTIELGVVFSVKHYKDKHSGALITVRMNVVVFVDCLWKQVDYYFH